MMPTDLKAAYATCTPPTAAKMDVTHAEGSVGTPPDMAVSAPHPAETAMAVQRATLPVMALVLMACTMYGTTSTVATVRPA